jgi:acyl-CoA synthetase (AMP-forming)/AMP-acid ligase II
VEIEDAVAAHPAVADVAAYAVPADEAEDEVMITALKSVG